MTRSGLAEFFGLLDKTTVLLNNEYLKLFDVLGFSPLSSRNFLSNLLSIIRDII